MPAATDLPNIDHLIIIRFSAAALIGRHGVHAMDPERLQRRLELFERICLPSLQAQTARKFRVILLVDPDLPSEHRARLEALTGNGPDTTIHTWDQHAGHRLEDMAWLHDAGLVTHPTGRLLTTRLDDDDALHESFVESAHAALAYLAADPPVLLIFEDGLGADLQGDHATSLEMIQHGSPKGGPSAGLSLLSEPSNRFNAYRGNHGKVRRSALGLVVRPATRVPMYLHVRHDVSVSALKQRLEREPLRGGMKVPLDDLVDLLNSVELDSL